MTLRAIVRGLLRKGGYDIFRFNTRNSPVARRIALFKHFGVDLVLDVGASDGWYGLELRKTAYTGHIVSFEPMTGPFAKLNRRAHDDGNWEAVNVGLGDRAGRRDIHVSQNSESSSLLPMLPRHAEAYPRSKYIGTESVEIQRLDDILTYYRGASETTFLKMDVQGYEHHVLEGAKASLCDITGVQLEMSLVPLYDGELRFVEKIGYLEDRGFTLMSLQPVIEDPVTGQLLQVDGLFFRAHGA